MTLRLKAPGSDRVRSGADVMYRMLRLEHPRLVNEHGGRVALRTPHLSVRGSGKGDGRMDILASADGKSDHGTVRADGRAFRIAEWNVGQFWNRFTRLSHSLIRGSSSAPVCRRARYLFIFLIWCTMVTP